MSFSNKDTRTRAGLFMTAHTECNTYFAARNSAAVLTSVSRVLWRTKSVTEDSPQQLNSGVVLLFETGCLPAVN
jgi:hypothetical protein